MEYTSTPSTIYFKDSSQSMQYKRTLRKAETYSFKKRGNIFK